MNNSEKICCHNLFEPLHPLSIGLRLSVILVVAVQNKSTPMQPSWAIIMILFAAMFIIPIAYLQIKRRQSLFPMYRYGLICHFLCALFLAFSFLMERSTIAGVFSIPYAVWCMEVFLHGIKLERKSPYIATLITFGFLANGALWLTFDRFGVQPLGFSAWIVILTGVHFHFAGFALMASLTLFLTQKPDNYHIKAAILAVVVGVVLTAIGIIATQLGYGFTLEAIAGVWMALSGTYVGFYYINKSFSENQPTKFFWFLGGLCLVLAMILACLYAARYFVPIDTLTLPFMQAIHGTLNALGFGTLMLLGWTFSPNYRPH